MVSTHVRAGLDIWRVLSWFQRSSRDPLLDSNEDFFFRFVGDSPIEDYEFVVLDTELTGFNARGDEIVSIGAVRIKGMRIVVGDNFYTVVKPKRHLPKKSILIHRITSERVKSAPEIEEVIPAFIQYCGNALLVGHHVHLDLSFINRECRRIMGGMMHNPSLDCALLARTHSAISRRRGQRSSGIGLSYNLVEVARRYGLPLFQPHDAFEDAVQTAYLFLYFVARLRARGLSTFKDFDRASRVAGAPRIRYFLESCGY